MGTSYASVHLTELCGVCGNPARANAQFYPSIGSFDGDMQDVNLGERLFENSGSRPEDLAKWGMGKSFPLIPLWQGRGYLTIHCDKCYPPDGPIVHQNMPILDCIVQIERGVVTQVMHPIPEDWEPITGPKNPVKEWRKQAAWKEECRRSHEERVRRLGTTDPMRLIGDAMASPLRRELLYSSIFRTPDRPQFLQMARERLKGLRGISDLLKPSRGRAMVIERLSDDEAAQL